MTIIAKNGVLTSAVNVFTVQFGFYSCHRCSIDHVCKVLFSLADQIHLDQEGVLVDAQQVQPYSPLHVFSQCRQSKDV